MLNRLVGRTVFADTDRIVGQRHTTIRDSPLKQRNGSTDGRLNPKRQKRYRRKE